MSLPPHYIRLSPEEKLDVIRRLDSGGMWESLDSSRYCSVCNKLFSGRQIEIFGDPLRPEPLRLHCATAECDATPADWRSSEPHEPTAKDEFSFIFEEDGASAPVQALFCNDGR